MKIIDWNINGLRAILKKNFLSTMSTWSADIICLQETKTNQPLPLGTAYTEHWCCGTRPGYSGTLTLINPDIKAKRVDDLPEILAAEGRSVCLDLGDFYLLNTYFPNGGQGPERLRYKMKFYSVYLDFIQLLGTSKPVLFTGDVNTAHQEIDLARPRENVTHTGFLPQERAWLDQVAAAGFVDIWRARHPGEVGYSWWDYKTRARERNVGWRIDYFFASPPLIPRVQDCQILADVIGSDHAPMQLIIK